MKQAANEDYVRTALADLECLEKDDHLIPVAISVCRATLSRLPPSDWQNRFKFVKNFVRYIGNGMPPPISISDSRLAIRILLDLERRMPSREKEKVARCRFFLAYLFSKGPAGKNLGNRRQAIKFWSQARQSYLRAGDRESWAEFTNALAEVYLQVYKGEKGITKAISLTKAALSVFTPQHYPEDNKIYSRFLSDLKADLKRLKTGHRKQQKPRKFGPCDRANGAELQSEWT